MYHYDNVFIAKPLLTRGYWSAQTAQCVTPKTTPRMNWINVPCPPNYIVISMTYEYFARNIIIQYVNNCYFHILQTSEYESQKLS